MFRRYFLPTIAYWFYRMLVGTWRIEWFECEELKAALKENRPVIFAHWHGDELSLLHCVRKYRVATMTSTSKDGALIDSIIKKLGGTTSRGSSTRGGVSALKGLIRLLRKGHNTSVAVDGPKGPIYKVKPGIFELARLSGATIIPVGVCCHRRWDFPKAWNKTFVPKPFAKVGLYYDRPLELITKGADPRSVELAEHLAQRLNRAKEQALNFIAQNNTQ